jgi:hypothetical protein
MWTLNALCSTSDPRYALCAIPIAEAMSSSPSLWRFLCGDLLLTYAELWTFLAKENEKSTRARGGFGGSGDLRGKESSPSPYAIT